MILIPLHTGTKHSDVKSLVLARILPRMLRPQGTKNLYRLLLDWCSSTARFTNAGRFRRMNGDITKSHQGKTLLLVRQPC